MPFRRRTWSVFRGKRSASLDSQTASGPDALSAPSREACDARRIDGLHGDRRRSHRRCRLFRRGWRDGARPLRPLAADPAFRSSSLTHWTPAVAGTMGTTYQERPHPPYDWPIPALSRALADGGATEHRLAHQAGQQVTGASFHGGTPSCLVRLRCPNPRARRFLLASREDTICPAIRSGARLPRARSRSRQ